MNGDYLLQSEKRRLHGRAPLFREPFKGFSVPPIAGIQCCIELLAMFLFVRRHNNQRFAVG
jgi:hypothetical protein